MASGKKDFIGLDIGSHSLKLVKFAPSPKGKELKLTGFAVERIPRGLVSGGKIVDQEGLKAAISGLMQKHNVKGVYAAAALPGVVAEASLTRIPNMSEAELMESVGWEYQQHLSYGSFEAVFDYQLLNGEEGENEGRRNLLLVGARREAVDGYLGVMEGVGLTLSELDVGYLALANTFDYNHGLKGTNGFLIHVGAEVTEIMVLDDGLPMFVRGIEAGGEGITRTIEKGLGVDFEKAESFKLGRYLSEDIIEEVDKLINRGTEELISMIHKALDDYISLGGSDIRKKVLLSGGCARLPALYRQLKERLSLDLDFIDPFKKVDYKKFNPRYVNYYTTHAAVAVGLALKGVLQP